VAIFFSPQGPKAKTGAVAPVDPSRTPKKVSQISCLFIFVLSRRKGGGSQFEAAGANAELTFGGNDSIIPMRLHHDEFKLLAEPIS
jgi:hypothetical protein